MLSVCFLIVLCFNSLIAIIMLSQKLQELSNKVDNSTSLLEMLYWLNQYTVKYAEMQTAVLYYCEL